MDQGLEEADWATRREIIRALVKQVEVSDEQVRVVYRVNTVPFVRAPLGGVAQDCRRRPDPFCPQRSGAAATLLNAPHPMPLGDRIPIACPGRRPHDSASPAWGWLVCRSPGATTRPDPCRSAPTGPPNSDSGAVFPP